jgi:hypothetical protein
VWNSGNGAAPPFSELGVSGLPTKTHSRQPAGRMSWPSSVNRAWYLPASPAMTGPVNEYVISAMHARNVFVLIDLIVKYMNSLHLGFSIQLTFEMIGRMN